MQSRVPPFRRLCSFDGTCRRNHQSAIALQMI
jgi:hypothetical protein